MADTIDLAGHVLNRCTFGIRPGDREALLRLGPTQEQAISAWLEEQLQPDSLADDEAEHTLRRFSSLTEPAGELFEYKPRVLRSDLARATVLRATLSRRQLKEVMVEFWTDHFNIDISKGDCAWLKLADDRDVIRRLCLGRFADLLHASITSPAMLWYLDGRVNRRSKAEDRPNENYARELLELHTLGVHGGYTQHDVMELARCLSGWTVRPKNGFRKGLVEFHQSQHDDDEKMLLGRRIPAGLGERDVDQVLDLVAHHPSTARRIAWKLCRRFIADEPPEAAVTDVARAFGNSGGEIKVSLRAVFARPEFGSSGSGSFRGSKLKRPFHFLVSALRSSDATTDVPPPLLDFLTSAGHAPFQYPAPDGYPIDSRVWGATLAPRWKLAADLAAHRFPGTRIDFADLRQRAGSDEGLMAHVLGRRPTSLERDAWRGSGGGPNGLALLLASPAFQRC